MARAPVPALKAPLAALGIAAYLALLLWADRSVGLPGQLVLGAITWVVLAAAWRPLPPLLRAQTALVVVVATCGEIVGSVIWGLYTYRLENLPSFVPPAHGLVFLGGVALARSAARNGPVLAGLRWGALTAVVAWGLAGVTVLERPDAGGAAGAVLLAACLLRGRAPHVYAGVFVVVAALELYGTAIGAWTWAPVAPGTPITQGNPPSGIASGYVVFDVVALWAAPRALSLGRLLRAAAAAAARGAARASGSGA